MVRDRRKYAFNPPKIRFRPNINLPTYATHKSNNKKHILSNNCSFQAKQTPKHKPPADRGPPPPLLDLHLTRMNHPSAPNLHHEPPAPPPASRQDDLAAGLSVLD
jgi:hypothetical protein